MATARSGDGGAAGDNGSDDGPRAGGDVEYVSFEDAFDDELRSEVGDLGPVGRGGDRPDRDRGPRGDRGGRGGGRGGRDRGGRGGGRR
jgi:uncharacterized protein